jgi:hypothetical protein
MSAVRASWQRGETAARNGQEENRWRRKGVRSRGRNGNKGIEEERGRKEYGYKPLK